MTLFLRFPDLETKEAKSHTFGGKVRRCATRSHSPAEGREQVQRAAEVKGELASGRGLTLGWLRRPSTSPNASWAPVA